MKTNEEKENLKVPFKAYKVFDSNWTCRDKQYKIGEEYKEDKIKICKYGIHACLKLSDCFNYYSFDSNNKVAEVTILGNFKLYDNDSKIVTDWIKIEKELNWYEVLTLCNSGNGNSGNGNSGNWNSGDWNSGDWNSGNENSGNRNSGNWNSGNWNSGNGNSGYRNSGNKNSGNKNSGHSNSGIFNSGNENSGYRNSGNRNSGDWNSGDCNSGNRNSGHRNSGDFNSGDFNSGYRNSGIFNSKENPIFCFNKISTITYQEWENHPAYNICLNFDLISFISVDLMTQQEQEDHPEYKTIGGYLKVNSYKKACSIWWNKLTDEEKLIIQTIPNFDKDVFFEITGIII